MRPLRESLRHGRFPYSLFPIALLLVACSKDGTQPQSGPFRSALEGTWRLEAISCDNQDSQAIPSSVLETDGSPVNAWVSHTGHTGMVAWSINSCIYRSKMENVDFQDSQMTIRFAAATCEGATCAGVPACKAPARETVIPFELASGKLTVTMPLSEFGGQPPCGAAQTDNVIKFSYDPESKSVPILQTAR